MNNNNDNTACNAYLYAANQQLRVHQFHVSSPSISIAMHLMCVLVLQIEFEFVILFMCV